MVNRSYLMIPIINTMTVTLTHSASSSSISETKSKSLSDVARRRKCDRGWLGVGDVFGEEELDDEFWLFKVLRRFFLLFLPLDWVSPLFLLDFFLLLSFVWSKSLINDSNCDGRRLSSFDSLFFSSCAGFSTEIVFSSTLACSLFFVPPAYIRNKIIFNNT